MYSVSIKYKKKEKKMKNKMINSFCKILIPDRHLVEENENNSIQCDKDNNMTNLISNEVLVESQSNVTNFETNGKEVRLLKLSQIEVDQEIAKSFSINYKTLESIKKSMSDNGYDNSQPIVVWDNNGKYIVVDGHTRRRAAMELGLEEIPIFMMKFESREDAQYYTFKRQLERRNLTQKELIKAIELQPRKIKRDGSGRADEILAKELGVSSSTITHTKYVIKNADEDQIEAIKSEEKSINKVFAEIKDNKKNSQSSIKTKETEERFVTAENIKKRKEQKNQSKIKTTIITVEELLDIIKKYNDYNLLNFIVENCKEKLSEGMLIKYFINNCN